MSIAPSEEPQVDRDDTPSMISSEHLEALLLPEYGARFHRLRAFGLDVLRTPPAISDHVREPFRWGAYVMAPWCNRIDSVPTVVGENIVSVASNSADGTALHGLVSLASWASEPAGRFVASAGGADGSGWPWPFETSVAISATDDGPRAATLSVAQTLTNHGSTPMPGGLGMHPWFIGPVEVRIAAAKVIESNLRPAEPIRPVGGVYDLRRLGEMTEGLDAAWLDLGIPPLELNWPTLGLRAIIDIVGPERPCIVAASPAGIGAVAVEPETHAPQGLRRLLAGDPDGLAWVAPGASIHLTTRMRFERRREATAQP